jgi:O-antigen/teichoic acid export membrane protein
MPPESTESPLVISTRKSLLREGMWIFLGQIFSTLGTLVGVRLITEKVVPEIYGQVSLLIGIVTFGRNIFCQPFCQAALRFYPDQNSVMEKKILRSVVSKLLLYSSTLLIIVVLIAGFLYGIYRRQSSYAIILLCALLGIDTWRILDTNFITAARNQKAYSIWGTLDSWGRPLSACVMVLLLGTSTNAMLLGYALASGTILLIFNLLPGVVPKIGIWHGPSRKTAQLRKEIITYALPLMPIALLAWLTQVGDRYLIAGLLGTEKVGIYAAAYGLASFPFLFIQSGIETTLRPLYFDTVAKKDKNRELKFFRVMLLSTSIFCE